VLKLVRVRIGTVRIGTVRIGTVRIDTLPIGQWRRLTPAEVRGLRGADPDRSSRR
jgi:16S rRNA U516 pseudouridylate synthase RsuA-like enzyme